MTSARRRAARWRGPRGTVLAVAMTALGLVAPGAPARAAPASPAAVARPAAPASPAAPSPAIAAPAAARLAVDERMQAGDELRSPDGVLRLLMQTDGNAVVYRGARPLWATGTHGHAGAWMLMQTDGNLVVYAPSGGALWASGTWGNPGADLHLQDDGNLVIYRGATAVWATDTFRSDLLAGESLTVGGHLRSPDGRYLLLVQTDGNVVLYDAGSPLWSTGTAGQPGGVLAMQTDGNLVLYATDGRPQWSTQTFGAPGAHLDLQVDANLVLYDSRSVAIWSSGTYVGRPRPLVVYTYDVRGLGNDTSLWAFAFAAAETLSDPRGWSLGPLIAFRPVASGGQFTLWLAEPAAVPGFGSPCDTTYSCRSGPHVVINEARWRAATPSWIAAGRSLRDYQHMVVNHELGHWLGFLHASCGGAGQLAPLMQQQSISSQGCVFNPWPLPGERAQLAASRGL